ncbi:MAG: hypothetical protein DYG89_08365 [Caldilinea sp. CFX5]|nr:hypothetical protein [Caldilinea sp. CFX5]
MDMERFLALEVQVDALRQQGLALAQYLSVAAEQLRLHGRLPAQEIIAATNSFRSNFATVANTIALLDTPTDSPIIAENLTQELSVDDLVTSFTRLWQVQEQQRAEQLRMEQLRSEALRLLARVRALVHRSQSAFPPLVACQQAAALLQQQIEAGTDLPIEQLILLAEGKHPLAGVLILIEAGAKLDDETFNTIYTQVTSHYDSALVTAILRDRIISSAEITEVTEHQPLPINDSLRQSAAPVVHDERMEDDNPLPNSVVQQADNQFSVITDDTESQETSTIDLISEVSATEEVAEQHDELTPSEDERVETTSATLTELEQEVTYGETDSPALVEADESPFVYFEQLREDTGANLSESPFATPVTGGELRHDVRTRLATTFDESSYQIAETILQYPDARTPDILWNLVWRLVAEDRLSLAYQLAQVLGPMDTADSLPKANLLRAVILGRYVRYDIGELATQLLSEFRRLPLNGELIELNDWSDAAAFFLSAATLRPSLLAPSTDAPAILLKLAQSGLPKGDNLQHFRDFCQAITTYAAYRLPLDLVSLHSVRDEAVWQQMLDQLLVEAAAWMEQAPSRTVVYGQASKVWYQWVKPGGIIYTLLKPVLENDVSKLASVRAEVLRLTELMFYAGRSTQPIAMYWDDAVGIIFVTAPLRKCKS